MPAPWCHVSTDSSSAVLFTGRGVIFRSMAESQTHKRWLDLLIVLLLHLLLCCDIYIIIINVLWTEGLSEINY